MSVSRKHESRRGSTGFFVAILAEIELCRVGKSATNGGGSPDDPTAGCHFMIILEYIRERIVEHLSGGHPLQGASHGGLFLRQQGREGKKVLDFSRTLQDAAAAICTVRYQRRLGFMSTSSRH